MRTKYARNRMAKMAVTNQVNDESQAFASTSDSLKPTAIRSNNRSDAEVPYWQCYDLCFLGIYPYLSSYHFHCCDDDTTANYTFKLLLSNLNRKVNSIVPPCWN